jgi:hypothetical protein
MSFEHAPHAPKTPTIRAALHAFPDGLTVSEICDKTFISDKVVRSCLKKMGDCYIDRWLDAKLQKPLEAVWCAVDVPAHCPKPERDR